MSTGNDEMVKVEKRNGAGIVTLNRPEALNALSTALLQAIGEAAASLEEDKGVRAVIITGARSFCAGADINEMKAMGPNEAEEFSRLGHRVFAAIEDMGKPVIAAINGFALGGGCELALACDLRIAAPNARIGQPEANLGLIPGFGSTVRLPRAVGLPKAKELIFTGKVLDANEALSIGLLNLVAAEGELMAKAEETAALLAGKGPLALKAAKSLLNRAEAVKEAYAREASSFAGCFETADAFEGMNAFLGKRPPEFKGE